VIRRCWIGRHDCEPERLFETVVGVPSGHENAVRVGILGNVGPVEEIVDALAIRTPRNEVREAERYELVSELENLGVLRVCCVPSKK
jgi:hypothetical protein